MTDPRTIAAKLTRGEVNALMAVDDATGRISYAATRSDGSRYRVSLPTLRHLEDKGLYVIYGGKITDLGVQVKALLESNTP